MSLDVLRARVAFRDRVFLDVMDLSLRFMVVHWRLYAKVAAIALLPSAALTLAAAWAWGWIAGWLVAFALAFAAQVPFTVAASRLVFQDVVSVRSVLRASMRDLPRIFVMRLMWTVLVAVGAVIVLVPGAYAMALLLFVDEVMILERASIGPAFMRSQRVATSSTGEAFGAVAMVLVVPVVAVLFADIGGRAFIGELLQFRAPAPFWTEGGSALAVIGWFGVIPYVATARFLTYLNLRTRAEGWDIQTRFAAIAARAENEGVS
jgi:hypothetical protein